MLRPPPALFRRLALLLTTSLVVAGLGAAVGATEAAAAGRGADAAGSAPVGTASYAAPSTAVYAAPWGSDSASGSAAAPVRTLARAVAIAPASGTVVLRAGLLPGVPGRHQDRHDPERPR